MIELLAPAKDFNHAKTAIDFGADAIYIGANAFGARKGASNTLDEIKKVVDYAHKFYVRVYVTINTILFDTELKQAQDLIWELHKIDVDAIIIQDFAILEMDLPKIAIFASTQCDNRDSDKVKFLEDIGFSRAILARELSVNEIKEIKKNTTIDIETFIHGALCVSYSGQCYMSSSIGNRSANRGECAQPCRKKYTLVDKNNKIIAKEKHLLSLKDFSATRHLDALINAGVSSFKIEGRLKDENYIKNVVGHYRKLIKKKTSSGEVEYKGEPNIEKAFNRTLCDYFLDKRKECYNFDSPKSYGQYLGKIIDVKKNYFILNADLHPQDGLFFGDFGVLVNSVDGNKIYPNKMNKIKKGMDVYRNKNTEKLEATRKIRADIDFYDKKIIITDEDKNKAELEYDYVELAQNEEKMLDGILKQLRKSGESDFKIESVSVKTKIVPFLPISQLNTLRRELLEKLMEQRLKNYKKPKCKEIKYAEFKTKNNDYRLNISNEKSKEFYEKCGIIAKEMAPEKTKDYAKKELMRTKHCLKYAFNMCKSNDELFLVDEKNKKYPLEFDCKNCQMIIKHP